MMKKVYICAPLGGDVQANLERVKKYTEYALKCGTAPVVPHFYALCLDDSIPREREMGTGGRIRACCGFAMRCGSSAMRLLGAWRPRFSFARTCMRKDPEDP